MYPEFALTQAAARMSKRRLARLGGWRVEGVGKLKCSGLVGLITNVDDSTGVGLCMA